MRFDRYFFVVVPNNEKKITFTEDDCGEFARRSEF